MIIEFEDTTTGAGGDYWGFAYQRGLLDRVYDRQVARAPEAWAELWQVYGTGQVKPGRATVRFTLQRGAPLDAGPTTQADAQSRYSLLLTRLTGGYRLWLCDNAGVRLWGREVYGAREVRLLDAPSAAWYYVEAELELEGHYLLWDQLTTDAGVPLTTDAGAQLYVRLYRE